jgi:hypothetical protein
MKRGAKDEYPPVVGVPEVVGLVVVRVQPSVVIVAFHVKDVRIAVGVGIV